jgi:hypothetical protein
MGKYVFVGTHCEIYDTPYKFSRFGQLAEVPDDVAKAAIASGAALLPQADFDKLGFNSDELKKFKDVVSHSKAPKEFIEKRDAAWKILTHGWEPIPPAPIEPSGPPFDIAQETK